MGRRIEIKKIDDSNRCQATFSKRRNNLIKKSYEISILCDIDLALVIFSASGKIYKFCSQKRIEDVIQRYLNLPPERRFHLTRNVQRGNTTCLCHKAEKLRQFDHIRGDENKLLHLENLMKDLELQITEATVELEVLQTKLKDYEPNPEEFPAPSRLLWMERNLKASLQLVKDRKTELSNNKLPSSSSHRKSKAQKNKKKKERPSCCKKISRNASGSTNDLNHQAAAKQNMLQMPPNPWIGSNSKSYGFHHRKDSFQQLLSQVSEASLGNNGLLGMSGNYAFKNNLPTPSLLPSYFGSSFSAQYTQIPLAYPPVQHQSVIDVPNTLGIQNLQARVHGSLSSENLEKDTPVEVQNYPSNWIASASLDKMFFDNLNGQTILAPATHSQVNPDEANRTSDYTFNSYQKSNNNDNVIPPLCSERVLPLEGCEFISADTFIAGAIDAAITTTIGNNMNDYEPDFSEFFATNENNNYAINNIENSVRDSSSSRSNNNNNNDCGEGSGQVKPLSENPTDVYSSKNLHQEVDKGDGTSSTAGTREDGYWNLDNLDWSSELTLEDLGITLD